jgi:hypothetical protein
MELLGNAAIAIAALTRVNWRIGARAFKTRAWLKRQSGRWGSAVPSALSKANRAGLIYRNWRNWLLFVRLLASTESLPIMPVDAGMRADEHRAETHSPWLADEGNFPPAEKMQLAGSKGGCLEYTEPCWAIQNGNSRLSERLGA